MIIKFEVLNGFNLPAKEVAEEILKAEIAMNSGSRLKFHLQSVDARELLSISKIDDGYNEVFGEPNHDIEVKHDDPDKMYHRDYEALNERKYKE